MTRRRRAAAGAVSTILQVIVLLGSQLVISPMVLHLAGNETLGQYAVVTQLTAYMVLLDFGFGQALQRFMARVNGIQDELGLKKLFSNARVWLLWIDFLRVFVLMAAVGYLLLQGDPANRDWTMPLALATLAAWFIVRSTMAGYPQGLTALQYISTVNYLTMIGSVVRLGMSIGLLWAGLGLYALVWGIVAAEFVLHYGSRIYYSRRFGSNRITLSAFSWDTVRPVAIFGLKSMPIGIAATSTFNSDSLISAYLFGAAATSVLFVNKLPVLQGTLLINRLVFSATPALYELHAQEEKEKLHDAFRTLHRYNSAASLFFAFGIILFQKPFIALWVGASQYGGDTLTLLFALYVIVMTTSNVNTQFLVAVGNIGHFSLVSAIQACAVIVLSIFFGWFLGVVGVVLGAVVSQAAFGGLFLWWVTLRYFNGNLLEFTLDVFGRPLVGFGVPCAVVFWLQHTLEMNDFGTSLSVYVGLSLTGFIGFVATRSELKMLRLWFDDLLRRKM